MAKCAHCGKTTSFGHNRSFSLRATNRKFLPNLQKVNRLRKGSKMQKKLCTKWHPHNGKNSLVFSFVL